MNFTVPHTCFLSTSKFNSAFRWVKGISPQHTLNVKWDKNKWGSCSSCHFDASLKEGIWTQTKKYQLGIHTHLIWQVWMIILSEDPRRKNMEEQLKATSESIWLTPPFYRWGNWGLEVSNDLLRSEGRWGWGRRFKINTLTSLTIPSPAGQVPLEAKGRGIPPETQSRKKKGWEWVQEGRENDQHMDYIHNEKSTYEWWFSSFNRFQYLINHHSVHMRLK